MKQETKSALVSKFFGGNHLLSYITRKEFRLGHRIKAAAFALYTYPLRKMLTVDNAFLYEPREYYEEEDLFCNGNHVYSPQQL